MGKVLTLLTFLVICGLGFVTYRCYFLGCHKSEIDFTTTRADGWFGWKTLKTGEQIPKDNTEIRPFTINISDSVLEDLKYRLDNTRYVDHVEDTKFTYGFNSLQLRKVVEYWQTKYNWRQQEKMLNQYPQFKTQIEGIDIHFLHVKPSKPAKVVLPLLISHGWPGSVLEYYKAIPLLTEPVNDVAFELVIPSIPGFAYSEAPHQKGFDAFACARVFVKLMKRLGHDKFFAHGGDFGNFITRITGSLYTENLLGVHLVGNFPAAPATACEFIKYVLAGTVPSLFFGENAQKEYEKIFPLSKKFGFMMSETGYMHIQATKPDTVGSALVDSPTGLAAYILEKFSTWTNLANPEKEDGGLTEAFTLDELLTNVMIYWTSNNIAASMRFYRENMLDGNAMKANSINLKVKVPAATIDAFQDLLRAPRKLIEFHYTDLLHYTEIDAGHFTAFQVPQLVSDDIRKFVHEVLDKKQQQQQQEAEQQNKDKQSKNIEM